MQFFRKYLGTDRSFLDRSVKLRSVAAWALIFNFYMTLPLTNLGLSLGNRNGVIEVSEESIARYDGLSQSLDARDYVNIASGLVNQTAGDNDYCKEMAGTTLSVFRELIERNNRRDLSDDVRVAIDLPLKDEGHVWLQIHEGDQWTDYETLMNTPVLDESRVRAYSISTKEIKANLEDADVDYFTIAGTDLLAPTLKSWSTTVKSGGLVGLMYSSIRNKTPVSPEHTPKPL